MMQRGKLFGPLIALFILATLMLPGCGGRSLQTENTDDLCELFRRQGGWYPAAAAARHRWGISIPIMMSIIRQESRFAAEAKPPRTRCLWVFPGPRPSSAYGYAQAGDAAWEDYKKWTGRGGADRDDFEDAVDFVGWYCHMSHIRCGIAKSDAYRLYLAYHEGHGGYNRRTYAGKTWLQNVAAKVARQARAYADQLAVCEPALEKRRSCCLWPF
ncbi:transglycosylase SLT domain-containing protein [Desulfatiglans anilini]|uniref:transglycosylase SLT domain-containing protein n=1 Tax=Desulfatiglans anilini TaxID=90728 RepID=UPI00055105BD|nr:transglycosylase SLT domain-containing protein [Desulfatiglans anilini]